MIQGCHSKTSEKIYRAMEKKQLVTLPYHWFCWHSLVLLCKSDHLNKRNMMRQQEYSPEIEYGYQTKWSGKCNYIPLNMAMMGIYLKFLLGVTFTFQAPLFWGFIYWNVRTAGLLLKTKEKVKRPNLNLSPTLLSLHLPGDSLDCTYQRPNKSSQIIIHLPVTLWFPKMTSRFSALKRPLMCPKEVTTWRTCFTFFSWFMMLGRIHCQKVRVCTWK